MAFQTGTRVNPRLGALDYSGFERAAAIRRQGVEQLGQKISGAVEKYANEQRVKKQKEMRYEAILPYVEAEVGDPEQAQKIAKQFASDPELGGAILQYAGTQRDQEALDKAMAVNTDTSGKVDLSNVLDNYVEFGGRDPKMVQALTSKAQENEYRASLMEMEQGNREALNKAIAVNTDTEGKVQWDGVLSSYGELGGTDSAGVAKLVQGLREGNITLQDVNDYTVVIGPGGRPFNSLPKPKAKSEGETPEEKRARIISKARKLFKEGKRDEADDLILGLNIRDNVTGMLVHAEAFFGGTGATTEGGDTPKQTDSLGIL